MKKYINTLALSAIAATAYAEEPDARLDPTVVKAEEEQSLVGKPDTSVTAKDLELIKPADLDDIFQKSPGVTVNGGRAQAQQIFVNGWESTSLNVTIDGAGQGNIYHHAGSVVVEPELLKSVDVFAGAGSALNGFGALGGAIQFETKNAYDLLDEGQDFGGMSKAVYYSNGEGFKLSQSFYGRLGSNWAYLLSAGYTDRDDYKDGNGDTVDLTAYESESVLLKFSGRFDGGHSLDIGLERVFSDTLSYDRLNVSEDFLTGSGRPTGLLQNVEVLREALTFKYGYNPENQDLIDLQARASFSRQEFNRTEENYYAHLETLDLDLRNTSQFGSFKTTYGVQYRHVESDINVPYLILPPYDSVKGGEEEDVVGFYIQNEWQLSEQFVLSFGGRYDYYDFTDVEGQNYDSGKFSPNAALTWQATDCLSFTGGYAEAYRGAGIRESFLTAPYPEGVEGEEAETVKLSFNYSADRFFATGSIYKQKIDNYLSPIPAYDDVDDLEVEGYDLTVGYREGGFQASVGVAHAEPDVKNSPWLDNYGMVVAGRRWIGEVSYAHEESGLTFGWNVEYRQAVDEEATPYVAKKDSYMVHNAFVSWDVQSIEGLSLSLNIDNVFDEDYQAHTIFIPSGLASPGREIRVGATYEF
ncbi:TonB-dependent receptor [Verrucomicrobiaceae bacterium 5K15]|uniref:TonB-dependent receptor n=1 Tax=Oceaniferula flava TaxID=2800421 RepID=A0AAE2VDY2_9BACT|nr:TonB-dependent receptor [Oceaniferula flavus]MBK1855149.1 TonB-dependent receptor [Oceaniferula flavus]MBM1136455.1 TonB-dependent receptor [Oceaniferula flavus]